MLYNRLGDNEKAEVLFREVVSANAGLHDIAYSLGLLLAEKKKYKDAAKYLKRAAEGMPEHARACYNLGLVLQYLKRDGEAEAALLEALKRDPEEMDYLYALAHYYMKREKFQRAKTFAKKLVAKHPDRRVGHDLLNIIKRRLLLGR